MNKIKSIVATLTILLTVTACGVTPEAIQPEEEQQDAGTQVVEEERLNETRGSIFISANGTASIDSYRYMDYIIVSGIDEQHSCTLDGEAVNLNESYVGKKLECRGTEVGHVVSFITIQRPVLDTYSFTMDHL